MPGLGVVRGHLLAGAPPGEVWTSEGGERRPWQLVRGTPAPASAAAGGIWRRASSKGKLGGTKRYPRGSFWPMQGQTLPPPKITK